MSAIPRANLGEAIEFLTAFHPGRPIHLVSLVPDGGATGKTFGPDDMDAMRAWIGARRGLENIYFTVAEPLDGVCDRKVKKVDLAQTRYLHADIDHPDGLERLRDYPVKPTAVLFSGGGWQGFWRLKEPTNDFDAIESRNRALANHLQADRVQNADRMMRVPGTINMPNEKKRAAGRTPTLAYIEREMTDWSREYTLDDFPPDVETGRAAGLLVRDIPQSVGIDTLPNKVTALVKALILNGDDAEHPIGSATPRFKSRSEVVFRVTCDLVRAGCPDEIVAGVLLSPEFGISASIREKKNAQRYALRQVASAREAVSEG